MRGLPSFGILNRLFSTGFGTSKVQFSDWGVDSCETHRLSPPVSLRATYLTFLKTFGRGTMKTNQLHSVIHRPTGRQANVRAAFCWSGRRTPGGLTLAAAALLVGTQAHAAIISNWFPASDYNANTPAIDGTLGITGYTIDSFASTSFISGLTVTLSGGITTTTWASLPNRLSGMFAQA